MDDMRFLTRARNLDYMYAIASNMYEWQFIYYSRTMEILDQKDFFQVSNIYALYKKGTGTQYSYADNDMKLVMAMVRALVLECHGKMCETRESLVV